jgi:hypothetical protein
VQVYIDLATYYWLLKACHVNNQTIQEYLLEHFTATISYEPRQRCLLTFGNKHSGLLFLLTYPQ